MPKYLDLNGLSRYDQEIKDYIINNIPALSVVAQSVVDSLDNTKIRTIALCTQQEYEEMQEHDLNTGYIIVDLDTVKEDNKNKITLITSESTHIQYASAKAVYDFVMYLLDLYTGMNLTVEDIDDIYEEAKEELHPESGE